MVCLWQTFLWQVHFVSLAFLSMIVLEFSSLWAACWKLIPHISVCSHKADVFRSLLPMLSLCSSTVMVLWGGLCVAIVLCAHAIKLNNYVLDLYNLKEWQSGGGHKIVSVQPEETKHYSRKRNDSFECHLNGSIEHDSLCAFPLCVDAVKQLHLPLKNFNSCSSLQTSARWESGKLNIVTMEDTQRCKGQRQRCIILFRLSIVHIILPNAPNQKTHFAQFWK